MTPEQLEALITYIEERSSYAAYSATDDEWPRGRVLIAEMKLREAFKVTPSQQSPAP